MILVVTDPPDPLADLARRLAGHDRVLSTGTFLDGGSGGITHLLQHLGGSRREWARDLGRYPETEDYIQQIAQGVDSELEGRDLPEMLRQRDELLIQLIAAKTTQSQIP